MSGEERRLIGAPDVMLDIETLSTKPGAVVFEACVLPFDRRETYTDGQLMERCKVHLFDVQAQLDAGRLVDARTLRFWLWNSLADYQYTPANLTDQARIKSAMGNLGLSLKGAAYSTGIELAEEICGVTDDDTDIWSVGKNFDPVILADWFSGLGIDVWRVFPSYRKLRCARDYVELDPASDAIRNRREGNLHKSDKDCTLAALRVCAEYQARKALMDAGA